MCILSIEDRTGAFTGRDLSRHEGRNGAVPLPLSVWNSRMERTDAGGSLS